MPKKREPSNTETILVHWNTLLTAVEASLLLGFWEQAGKAAASDGKGTAEPTIP